MSKKLVVGCALISALISTGVGMMFAQRQPVVGNLPDFSTLIEEDGPAVVNIRTIQKTTPIQTGSPAELETLLHSFFAKPIIPKVVDDDDGNRGVGSGFFISKDGYLLTNAHVVEGASTVIVTLADRREFNAEVVGSDARTDIALLKVKGDTNFPFLKIGSSRDLKVGSWAFAIGSPYNLENTATAGIISAVARDAGEYLPLIQSDVSINPGNSGGPLIDIHGKVIGINSHILQSISGGTAGISFAIPIDEAMLIAKQLGDDGKVTRSRIGAQIGEPPLTVFMGAIGTRVVQILMVEEGGPADKAGMQAGDIILKFDGEIVNGPGDLPWRVGSAKPGSTVPVTVLRGDNQFDINVKMGKLDENRIQYSENIDLVSKSSVQIN